MTFPILIDFKLNDKEECGSGFFYNDSIYVYLVTAKHVIMNENVDRKSNKISYTFKDSIVNVNYYPRNADKNPSNTLTLYLDTLFNPHCSYPSITI